MAEGSANTLATRILSAVVLAPPVLGAIYFGTPWFELLIAIAAAIMAWEWNRLCGRGKADGVVLIGVVVAAVGSALFNPSLAVLFVVAGSIVLLTVLTGADRGETADRGALHSPLWSAAGVVYVGLPCIALIWLRGGQDFGRDVILWLFLVVWAADIGAYVVGRTVGGPRLAPALSPNKTWSGLCGGVACAGAVSAATATILGKPGILSLALFGAFLGIVEQAGDLTESWVKRRSGVKDAGSLIPGHGGLLDRADGLLAASVVVAAFGIMGKNGYVTWL